MHKRYKEHVVIFHGRRQRVAPKVFFLIFLAIVAITGFIVLAENV